MPLRWEGTDVSADADGVSDMTAYLAGLCRLADVTVVDGSADGRFAQHHAAWEHLGPALAHCRPDDRPGLNRKVVAAMTGIRSARHDRVVLADDDVRHDAATLRALHDRLDDADLVRPQNVFTSWPWHARLDGARSMLNRAVANDWPGTFGLRRGAVLALGGWDPDVMFENLELVRTLHAAGARVADAPDLLVPRVPPTTHHFWSQRVRQAYDDLAQPWRLATRGAPPIHRAQVRCSPENVTQRANVARCPAYSPFLGGDQCSDPRGFARIISTIPAATTVHRANRGAPEHRCGNS